MHSCLLCARVRCSRKVLSDLNGDWSSQILFVAEAPGRLGAEVTGIPLFGDRTGDRFEEILKQMRLRRSEVFITNAVLCNARDEAGNNDTPSQSEIKNCSSFLRRTVEFVNPRVVIALGRVALQALNRINEHGLTLRDSVGHLHNWNGRRLGVLYHPGPRTAVHRSWELQLEDADKVARAARRTLSANSGFRHTSISANL